MVEFKDYFIKQGQQLSHRAKLLIVTIRKSFVFYNHESHVNYGIKQQAEKVLKYSNTVFFMRTKIFVHLTHLKLSQVSLTYLKIFVYLEHLIKIHLEYLKIYF